MLSNKEKRLSQVYDVYTNEHSNVPPSALASMIGNHYGGHQQQQQKQPPPSGQHYFSGSSYGMVNNNNVGSTSHQSHNGGGNSSSSAIQPNSHNQSKDNFLKQKHFAERSSHSLNNDFSQLYISNLKNHMAAANHSFTQAKKPSLLDGRHEAAALLPSLEEMNSYKKETIEAKKQVMQMEKSITYWSECTEYWRGKWRKTREERNVAHGEIKQLKSKLARIEHQLKQSEDKRCRLTEEVHMLHGELNRCTRFDAADIDGRIRTKHSCAGISNGDANIHYNSDRRVDYRKQRRKKDFHLISTGDGNSTRKHDHLSSTEEEDQSFHRFDQYALPHCSDSLPLANKSYNIVGVDKQRAINQASVGTPSSATSSKVVLRNHERLFDKKIVNRKRFSQVVMCDEDELFQFNQEIPALVSNSLSRNGTSEQKHLDNGSNDQQRFMEHVSEEEEEEEEEGEEDCLEEEDPDDKEVDSEEHVRRQRRKQLNADCMALAGFETSTHQLKMKQRLLTAGNGGGSGNHSNLSTMATNSECANVGSIRTDDVDEDSIRSSNNNNHQAGVAGEDGDDEHDDQSDEDDEDVEEEDDEV